MDIGEKPGRATWNLEEVGEYLGIGRTLAYRAARRGEIPALKIGGRWVVSRRALEEMLMGHWTTVTPAPGIEKGAISE